MPDSDAPPHSPSPRETIWEAIVLEKVTPEIAGAMFELLAPDHDEGSGSVSEQGSAAALKARFLNAVADLASLASPQATTVLGLLVQSGGPEESSRHFENMLGDVPPGERERIVDLLLTKAGLFGPADPRIAIDACERVLDLRPGHVFAQLVAADMYTMTGELVAAERTYRSALAAPWPDDMERATVVLDLADVVRKLGRRVEADELLAETLAARERLGDMAGKIDLLYAIAEDAETRRDFGSEKRWRTELLSAQEGAGDEVGRAATLTELAADAADRGDYEVAAKGFREAASAWKRLGDDDNRSWALWRHGVMEQDRGRLDAAQKLFERALRLERKLEDRGRAIVTLGSLADLAERRGRARETVRYLEQALVMAEAIGNHAHAGKVSARLGEIARSGNRLRDELKYCERAAEHFERAGSDRNLALMLGYVGACLLTTGDLDEAEPALDRARGIFDRLGERKLLGAVLFELGRVSERREDIGTAGDRYGRAASILGEEGDLENAARAYTRRGHMCLGDGDFEGAISNLDAALRLYTDLGRQDTEQVRPLRELLHQLRTR